MCVRARFEGALLGSIACLRDYRCYVPEEAQLLAVHVPLNHQREVHHVLLHGPDVT